MPPDPPCTQSGYQVLCVEADVQVAPVVTPRTPIVTCIGVPSVVPIGTHPCAPFTAACGFTIAQSICVQVPVTFDASAVVSAVRHACGTASTTPCTPTAGAGGC